MYGALVANCNKAERLLLDAFGDHQVRKVRKYFRISPVSSNSLYGSTDVYAAVSNALADLNAERAVTCERNGRKSYDRFIGSCSALGTDFGTFMTESGWSCDWKYFSSGMYAAAKNVVRTDRRGLWGVSSGKNYWDRANTIEPSLQFGGYAAGLGSSISLPESMISEDLRWIALPGFLNQFN